MEAEEELVKEMSSLALSKEPPIILKTSFQKCPVCLIGTIVNTQEKSTLLIYGSFGVKVAEHQVHRCSNRNKLNPCRIGAFYMVISQSMGRRYTPECLKNEFLVVSNQTAFERDHLIEVVADIYLLQGCFENISKKFNRLKNRQLPTATRERRMELYRKTLTNAFSSTPSLNMVKGMPSKAGKESRAAWRKQWWI